MTGERTRVRVNAGCAGKDVIGLAQTGSGKTGAFALPILQDLLEKQTKNFALVLSPTRELAIQVPTAERRPQCIAVQHTTTKRLASEQRDSQPSACDCGRLHTLSSRLGTSGRLTTACIASAACSLECLAINRTTGGPCLRPLSL